MTGSESKRISRRYVTGQQGEIHLRIFDNDDPASPPLLCLHPAPYSGLYFETIMPLITKPGMILAPDYPGYGGSYIPDDLPDIASYASAMLDVLTNLNAAPVDLLGFHTGCLVAAEMALQCQEQVGRIILIDIPYFTGEQRESMYASAAQPPDLGSTPDCLEKSFNFNVRDRLDHVEFGRAFELFVEQLRPGKQAHWAFHAAFSYEAAQAFARLNQPGLIIATHSSLLEPTRQAAALLPSMQLMERPDITRSVLEEGAAAIAMEIDDYLASDI